MSGPERWTAVLDEVCAEVAAAALGSDEVAERLIVVTKRRASIPHAAGLDVYESGGTLAFVNSSGAPFVEQADHLIRRLAPLEPEAVLLAGSALTGRPGGQFRRVLAVQLFSRVDALRMARIAQVEPSQGAVETILPWKDVKPGPPVWAERILLEGGRR
ncbi:hypothetical protein AB0L06_41885 [Spirillospora sp. NPDC052269]